MIEGHRFLSLMKIVSCKNGKFKVANFSIVVNDESGEILYVKVNDKLEVVGIAWES